MILEWNLFHAFKFPHERTCSDSVIFPKKTGSISEKISRSLQLQPDLWSHRHPSNGRVANVFPAPTFTFWMTFPRKILVTRKWCALCHDKRGIRVWCGLRSKEDTCGNNKLQSMLHRLSSDSKETKDMKIAAVSAMDFWFATWVGGLAGPARAPFEQDHHSADHKQCYHMLSDHLGILSMDLSDVLLLLRALSMCLKRAILIHSRWS